MTTAAEFSPSSPQYRLVLAIAKSDMFQKDIAAKVTRETGVKVSTTQMSEWANGVSTPSLRQLVALAEALGDDTLVDWRGVKASDIPDPKKGSKKRRSGNVIRFPDPDDAADLHDPSSGCMRETAGQAA